MRTALWKTVVAALTLTVASASAQTPVPVKPMAIDAHPSFEVATIKPSDPEDSDSGFRLEGRRMVIENRSMDRVIAFAYGVDPKQIVDGPEWLSRNLWNIQGVPDVDGEPSVQQMREMVQKLLAKRFGLKFHHAKRELSIFAITIAKGGPKLAVSKSDPNSTQDQTGSGNRVEQTLRFRNATIADFAEAMQYNLDRPVVDETGLKGKFDFELKWRTDDSVSNDPEAPPGLFTAVQEQLGLKIEATKGPADVFVIDHIDRPSAN